MRGVGLLRIVQGSSLLPPQCVPLARQKPVGGQADPARTGAGLKTPPGGIRGLLQPRGAIGQAGQVDQVLQLEEGRRSGGDHRRLKELAVFCQRLEQGQIGGLVTSYSGSKTRPWKRSFNSLREVGSS